MSKKKTYEDENTTSWEKASRWYNDIVGEEGHYYHQHVIFPLLSDLLKTKKQHLSLLDLGCGQGAFASVVPKNYSYTGVDISPSFIKLAKKTHQGIASRDFHVFDVCSEFDLKKTYSHASMILAFQNICDPKALLLNVKRHLKQGGTLILVLNHPCYRIPRQSSWGVDEEKKIQYRRIDSYMSEKKIPIETHPGRRTKTTTFSFHYSLTKIFSFLSEAGFTVANLIESVSDKKSTGKYAKMEDRAREEFPLFLTLVAKVL